MNPTASHPRIPFRHRNARIRYVCIKNHHKQMRAFSISRIQSHMKMKRGIIITRRVQNQKRVQWEFNEGLSMAWSCCIGETVEKHRKPVYMLLW